MERANLAIGLLNIGTAVLVIGLSIPLVKGWVRMNAWYGFKVSKAYESEEMWRRVNRVGGRVLIWYSLPLVALGMGCLFLPKLDTDVALALALAPLVYLVAVIHASISTLKL